MAAPVDRVRLTVKGDRITGHAAPATGLLPCVLRLEADGAPIAVVRATGFSPDAAAAGIWFGWCGVEMTGLRLAAALADVAQVRCHASDRLLLEVPLPASPPPSATPPLPVTALIDRMRAADVCTDIEQILPFAFATLHRGGIGALVDACYLSLLRRPPEPVILKRWQDAPTADPVRAVLLTILTSPEYAANGRIPAPFHPDFAFDRTALDG